MRRSSLAALFLVVVAGLVPVAGFALSVTLEPGTDRLGADYKGFELADANPQICQQACAGDAVCKAFSFVKPGVKGPKAMCFLKSSIAPATPNPCCTSGAKQGDAPVNQLRATPVAVAPTRATIDFASGPGSAGTICATTCANAVSTVTMHDAKGTCVRLLSYPCHPYACDKQGTSCGAKCQSSADCATGASCNDQTGQCAVVVSKCKNSFTAVAADGQETVCSPYLCDGGTCAVHCQNDGECSTGRVCDVEAQLCRKP